MTREHQRIRARVRKLLGLAEGSNFEGEIRNAAALAQQLMNRHHLTMKDIFDLDEDAVNDIMGRFQAYTTGSNLSAWEADLAAAISTLVGTVGWYYESPKIRRDQGIIVRNGNGKPSKAVPVTYYGPAEDVELACHMFRELGQTILAMARLKYNGAFRGAGRCYCEGFVAGLKKQVQQGEAQRSTKCTAIVTTTRQKAHKWLAEHEGIQLASSSSSRSARLDDGAYADGRLDGEKTDFTAKRTPKLASQAFLPAPGTA